MKLQYETIEAALQDHVCTIRLNRPERRNALNWTGYRELEEAFREAQADPEVRVIVLTGADPAFCSGDDVQEILSKTGDEDPVARRSTVRPPPTPAAATILDCDRPVIAAVNGAAVGWGMDLALFADMRIASERARFGELFVKRGLVADLGGMVRLPHIVGPQRAAELLFTGDIIDAETARDYGIVMDVVAHEDLMEHSLALASRIAANPPLAVRHLKEGLRRAYWGDYREMGAWVGTTLSTLFKTEDHREGVASFLEKREPVFKGR